MRAAAVAVATFLLFAGCGAGARGPAQFDLFVGRARAEQQLRDAKLCREPGPQRRSELYRRCDEPGHQRGAMWARVEYDRSDRLALVQIMERYATAEEATERWNQLVQERAAAHGEESKDARSAVTKLGRVPAGTTLWMSWYVDGGVSIVSVYLVRDAVGDDPNVVQEFVAAPR